MATTTVPARYWHKLEDDRIQCDLCPRYCKLTEGQRGLCFVRAREGEEMVLTTYGLSSGFAVDPIEKKPLNHFLPGTEVLSFGTAGCNLTCKFCQNWSISKSRETQTLSQAARPEAIANAARRYGCPSVAFTYNDPVVFHEFAIDTAQACRELGIRTVAVTAGYVCEEPRAEFYRYMDAANVDLKGFTERFYREVVGGHLQPVLDTLVYLKQKTNTWLEITTLLIPGENSFHPDWRMQEKPRTEAATQAKARRIAKAAGIRYAYVGNIFDEEGASTHCHQCGSKLIGRNWHRITAYNLTGDARCAQCGARVAGVFS